MKLAARLLSRWRPLLREDRAAVAGIFAIAALPLISSVALAVDYAVITNARIALQHAVDEAALAGAGAYTDSTQASNAVTVATSAFNAARLPGTLAAGTPTVTSNDSGTINPNLGTQTAYTVTVADTAQLTSGFLRIFRPSLSITVSATAADPKVSPQITVSNVRASACDGNTVYLYTVPMSNGKPQWTTKPTFTTGSGGNYYDIGNNYGQSIPSGQSLPTVTATQPLGIMLANLKNGNCSGTTAADSYGNPNGYSANYYSAFMEGGQPPSQDGSQSSYTLTTTTVTTTSGGGWYGGGGNSSSTTTYTANWGSGNVSETAIGNPSCNTGTTTSRTSGNTTTQTTVQTCSPSEPSTSSTYPVSSARGAAAMSATPNCSLYVQTGVTQSYINGLSNASSPPNAPSSGQQGSCYSGNSSADGWKYAAPTCTQLSALPAQTAVFWWNDTGGSGSPQYGWSSPSPGDTDDRDYNDAFFALTCTVGNGGSGTGLVSVVLTQ